MQVKVEGLTIKRESTNALLVETEDGREIWLPLSQISKIERSHAKGGDAVVIERWVAEREEIEWS